MHYYTDNKEVSTWPGVKHAAMIMIRRFKSRLLVNRTYLTVSNAPFKPLRLAVPTVTVGSLAMAWKPMGPCSVVPIAPHKKAPRRCGIACDEAAHHFSPLAIAPGPDRGLVASAPGAAILSIKSR